MQIKQFPLITTIQDNDLLLVQMGTGTYKSIKASDIKKYCQGVITSPVSTYTLTFQSPNDTNGVFYWIGTNKGTTVWQNPTNRGLVISVSSTGSGSLESLVDRQNSEFYTESNSEYWVKIKLPGTAKLNCNYYLIKTRSASSNYYPRNWKLQGSNNDSTWIDLDIQSNNTTLNSNSQWLSIALNCGVSYNYFKLLTTGINSSGSYHFVLGEIELYGAYEE